LKIEKELWAGSRECFTPDSRGRDLATGAIAARNGGKRLQTWEKSGTVLARPEKEFRKEGEVTPRSFGEKVAGRKGEGNQGTVRSAYSSSRYRRRRLSGRKGQVSSERKKYQGKGKASYPSQLKGGKGE